MKCHLAMLGKHKTLILNKYDEKKRNLFGNIPAGQWNQFFSGLMCCVGFCLIFSMMLYITIVTLRKEEPSFTNTSWNVIIQKKEKALPCSVETCIVSCSQYFVNHSSTILEELLADSSCPDGITLKISRSIFPENKIMKNWLNSSVFQVRHLQFEHLTIDSIEPEAFQHSVFHKMKNFYLGFCTISHFKRDALKGLANIEELNIWNSAFLDTEKEGLIGIENTVTALNIRQCLIDVHNLIADLKFPKLATVVFNNTEITKIQRNTLIGLSFCISLYLASCSLREIEDASFNNLIGLEILHLQQNSLKNLPANLFSQTSLQKLYIEDNDWQCTCNMEWVKNLTLLSHDFNKTLCKEPENAEGKKFTEIDFCEVSVSTTTIPLFSSTYGSSSEDSHSSTHDIPKTTPYFEEKYFNISCQQYKSDLSVKIIDKTDKSKYYDSKINGIRIFGNDSDLVVIEARPTYSINDVLIWFESRDNFTKNTNYTEFLKCYSNIETKAVIINGLLPGKSYSFCLLRNGNRHVSPFDCKAYLVPLAWIERPWLVEKQKPLVIVIVVITTIITCISGAAVVYIIVRRNPILLRGSKRIVMVKNNETKAIVLPPNYSTESKKSNTCDPVTTKQNYECRRRNLKRSVSEASIVSSKSAAVSYVSALEPTPVQLLHWRLERLRGGVKHGEAIVETFADISPPPSILSIHNLQTN